MLRVMPPSNQELLEQFIEVLKSFQDDTVENEEE